LQHPTFLLNKYVLIRLYMVEMHHLSTTKRFLIIEKIQVHFYIFSSFENLEAYNFDTIGTSIEHISVLGNLCFINLGVHYVKVTHNNHHLPPMF
jgi:hypothetical protein